MSLYNNCLLNQQTKFEHNNQINTNSWNVLIKYSVFTPNSETENKKRETIAIKWYLIGMI